MIMKITLTLFFFTVLVFSSTYSQNVLVLWDDSPTNGKTVSLTNSLTAAGFSVTLSNVSGKVIQSHKFTQSQILNLSLDELAGIYLVSVQTENTKAFIRLVKE